jgi:hypothetical protein
VCCVFLHSLFQRDDSNQVETKYYNYCAWHILYTHGLAEKEYRDLVSQPLDLILALYRDERILRKNEVNPCPDINRAAEALASLFGEDVKRIRYNLINDWLSDNTFPHVRTNQHGHMLKVTT